MELSGDPSATLRRRAVAGSAWSVAASWSLQLLSIAVALALVRLLTPEAFGLIGMVTVFTGFVAMLGDPGLSAALIQKQDATESHYRSVFWASVTLGLSLSLALAAAAPLIASFYRAPQLLPLALFMAPIFLLASLSQVQAAILQKRMDYRALALADLGALVASGSFAVGLAASGYREWSLAAQSVALVATRSGLLWLLCDWRPRLGFDAARLKDLLGFGGGALAFSFGNYWIRNADNLLIGKLLGKQELGLYGRAYSIMLLPISLLSGRIGAVLFSAFSTIQSDLPRVASAYLRSIAVVSLVTFPMMIGLLLSADAFVPAVLGEQWLGVVPLLRILCVVGMIESIGTLNGSLYLSQGRTGLRLKVLLVVGPLALAAIVIGVRWGIVGVAAAYAVYSAVVTIPTMAIPLRLVGLTLIDVARALGGVLGSALLMGVGVWGAGRALPVTAAPLARLALQVAAGAVVYAGALLALRVSAARDLAAVLAEQWRSRAGAGGGEAG